MELSQSVQTFISQRLVFEILCLPYNYPFLEQVEAFRDGYRFNSVKQESLVTSKKGDWQENWFVIATNYFADPFYIDTSEASLDFPVYFSRHGQGKWQPVQVSSSVTSFTNVLTTLKSLDRTEALEFLQYTVDTGNRFWQEVIEEYSSPENEEARENTETDLSEWISGKLFITDLGSDKLRVISYLKTQFKLTSAEAMALTKQAQIEVASGYLVHLRKKMEFLENLGATVRFVKDEQDSR
jgi:hypothetical protein